MTTQTEAVFENIAERIKVEINKAQKSIVIAVAWFTNKSIFDALTLKANNGCEISLMISNDKINENSTNNYDKLLVNSSRVYKIGDGEKDLMHNKFCIIDYSTVITGSYNWSYKAENNLENIIVTFGDTILAKQFLDEFDNIRRQYFPDELKKESPFPLSSILHRLEILKNYILLEDADEIIRGVTKLRDYEFNSDLKDILVNIENREYASAINNILYFISKNQQLLFWIDPLVAALKFEIKNLEHKLIAFDNEIIELNKFLSEFFHRHTIELGDLVLEILKYQKIKFETDKTKFDEAEYDEQQYQEQFNQESARDLYELSDEQKLLLKKAYRKAALLCHTDKFQHESLEVQKQAEDIFKELNDANNKNDIKRVIEILNNLEKGLLSTTHRDRLNDIDKLKATIVKLKTKVNRLECEIISIKESEPYLKVQNIKDWDLYFKNTRETLLRELESLKEEIN